MRMPNNSRLLRFCVTLIITVALGVASRPVSASSINYGNSPVVAPGVIFQNIVESSGTDPSPLYGAPASYFTTGIDFDPTSFVSTANAGGLDITDGQLNFRVVNSGSGVGINSISITENGDFALFGTGTNATQVSAGTIIRVTVNKIDGVAVSPLVLSPANASVAFGLLTNPGLDQPWSIGSTLNISGQLTALNIPYTTGATDVSVAIDNTLATATQTSSLGFIAKKEFLVGVSSNSVPEPASLSIFAVAFAVLSRRRRRTA